MTRTKNISKIINGVLTLCLAVLLTLLSSPMAFAAVAPDTSRQVNLTVRFVHEGVILDGCAFSVYRVATVSDDNSQYILTDDFKDYGVSFQIGSTSGWRALAVTLESYVLRDRPTPIETNATDSEGLAVFQPLDHGLYLVIGEKVEKNGYVYTPEPILMRLPYITEDGEWEYDVTAEPKRSLEPTSTPDTISVNVIKIWKDNDEAKRPTEVMAELLCDGEITDSVVLSPANNWRHTWTGLDAARVWKIVESHVPEGYTVLIEQRNNTFIITNSIIPNEPDDPPPPSEPKLPQTGLLWWPVPVLSVAGFFLLAVGIVIRKRPRNEE